MPNSRKKKLVREIVASTLMLIVLSIAIALFERYFPHIVNIKGSDTNLSVIRVVIQTTGIFMGFIITSFVMKFSQIDTLIQGLSEDMARVSGSPYHYRNLTMSATEVKRRAGARVSWLLHNSHLLKTYIVKA